MRLTRRHPLCWAHIIGLAGCGHNSQTLPWRQRSTAGGGKIVSRLLLAVLAIFAMLGTAGQALAAPQAARATSTSLEAPVMNRPDVEAWLDGFMPQALKHGDVAGAVVVIVKDGQILAQKGYGYADVAKRRPIDPGTTLFRAGSTSKLFTWTAVMQLVERGKLDLDRDVNSYLDFSIPPFGGKPVTLRNIMTHTAGFEEMLKGLMFSDPRSIKPLGEVLKQRIPRRIFAPGTTPAYSNYATGLAAYIVERVSGMSYDAYVERYILQPLQMTQSSLRQPLPKRYLPSLSNGYDTASTPPKPYELLAYAPAGALSATGVDMAKFIIAHLDRGGVLLWPETARMMHDTKLTILPGVNRMALGFYEQNINGRLAVAHGGDTQWFHSDLWLFPAEKVGAFISLNSNGIHGAASDIRTAFFEEFADRYLPEIQHPGRVDAKTAADHAKMMVGTYLSSRRTESNFLRLMQLAFTIKVNLDDQGNLLIPAIPGPNGRPRKWVEIAPFVWRDADGHERLAAQLVNGRVARISHDMLSPIMVFDRVPWYGPISWIGLPFLLALSVLMLTALSWPAAALARRHYGVPPRLNGAPLKVRRLNRALILAVLATMLAWVIMLTRMSANLDNLDGRFDGFVAFLQVTGLTVLAGLVVTGVADAYRLWRGQYGWAARFWSGAVVAAGLLMLWAGIVFKVVGVQQLVAWL